MRVIFKQQVLILVPETPAEGIDLAAWKELHGVHVLAITASTGEGLALADLGLREDACNEPINIVSNGSHPAAKLISNFGETPFEFDGREYASVESFWQGLKFEKESDRRRIAAISGPATCDVGKEQGYAATVRYEGKEIAVGTWDHWQLMRAACEAKFAQNFAAREALLSTGERPLIHRVRRDSRTIPGAIMAEIWMRIRKKSREGE